MQRDQAGAYADRFERMFTDVIRRGKHHRPIFAGRLPRAQFVVLQVLDLNGSMRASDLAGVLEVTPPAVSSLVGNLEKAGLVGRSESPDDRRVTLVALSAKGREVLQIERTAHRARVSELLRHFESDEIETVLSVMKRVHEMMGKSE